MARRLLFLLAAAGLSLSLAVAQPSPQPGRPGGMGHGRMMEKLNLSDQQKDQMQKLHAAFEKKVINNQAKVRTLRVDLRTAAMADNPDRGAIEKLVAGISELQQQGKMDLIDHLFAVRAILTPEQVKLFKSHMMQVGGDVRQRIRERIFQRGPMRGELPGGESEDLMGETMGETFDEEAP